MNLASACIAAELRHSGREVSLIDGSQLEHDFQLSAEDDHLYLLTGYIDDFSEILAIVARIRALDRDGSIIAIGGPHVTLLGRRLLHLTDQFDLVCLGDALPRAVSLATSWTDRPGATVFIEAEPRDRRSLADEPPPAYDLWPTSKYLPILPLEFTRGCPHRCPFCTDPVLRSGVEGSTVARVLDLFRRGVDAGFTRARFVDSSLTSLGSDLEALLKALARTDHRLPWGAFGYPSDITPSLAELLALAGCTALFLGIESLAPGVRTGKRHGRAPSIVADGVRTLQDQGIFVHGNFIVGLPGETEHTAAETRARAVDIGFDSIGGGPFYLTPGSTFDTSPERFGIEVVDPQWALKQHENFWEPSEYFRTETMRVADMQRLVAEFEATARKAGVPWGMSDYQLLAWESVGGQRAALVEHWLAADAAEEDRVLIDVLRDKRGSSPVDDFVTRLAAMAVASYRPSATEHKG